MYCTRDTVELRELLSSLRETRERALCFVSFQKESINDLIMNGLFIGGKDFDINQIDINYDDALNDILKKVNWETGDEQVYQTLVIVYIPNDYAKKTFDGLDEASQEENYGINIKDSYIYAYVDLIDMQIRYNDNCVALSEQRTM